MYQAEKDMRKMQREATEAAEKPELELTGHDGNAFSILGRARRVAKRAGWSTEKIEEYTKKATSGSYDELLAVTMEYFDVH